MCHIAAKNWVKYVRTFWMDGFWSKAIIQPTQLLAGVWQYPIADIGSFSLGNVGGTRQSIINEVFISL